MMTDDTVIGNFFKRGHNLRCDAGQIILFGDDINPDIFYLDKGMVKVYSINDDGEEYVHLIYKPGELFPLIWALRDRKRHIFFEALTECTLWKVSKKDFVDHLRAHTSPFAYSLMVKMAEQFNVYSDRLDNLQYKSAYGRLIYRLLFLASRFGDADGKQVTINAPLTHKILAQSINLARESVSREFEKLVKKGLIESHDNRIIIKDVDKLAEEFSAPVSLDLWGLKK